MYLVRVGYRTINLEYLIETTDSALGAPPDEAPPGKVRVSVYPGKTFDVGGEAADQLRLHLDDNIKPIPAKRKGEAPQIKARRGTSERAGTPRSKPQEE